MIKTNTGLKLWPQHKVYYTPLLRPHLSLKSASTQRSRIIPMSKRYLTLLKNPLKTNSTTRINTEAECRVHRK